MIKYGFFNSVNNDRVYDAETFNTFFEGLISSNGVFEGVRGGFIVSSSGVGLRVSVDTGKAIVNNHWVVSDSVEKITLNTAHSVLPRYDMISLVWDDDSRTISLRKTTGTPASDPVKPTPVRVDSEFEIALAYVHVKAGAITITDADVIDCRYDNNVCGIITGLIAQVDTGTLYRQFMTELEELRANFDTWFRDLTEDLNVDTYVDEDTVSYDGDGDTTVFDMPDSYSVGDIVDVYLNNIRLIPNVDYTITGKLLTKSSEVEEGNTLIIRVLKSKIGFYAT